MGGHARKKATRRVVPCTAVCTPGSRRTAEARLPRARARSGYGCCTSRCTAARAPRAIASWCLTRISPQATTERCTSTKRGSRSDPGGAIAACARASVRPRRCAVAALDSLRRVPATTTRTPRRSAAVPTVWRASGSAQTLSRGSASGLRLSHGRSAAFRGSLLSDERARV